MLPPTPTERLAYVKVITKPNSDTPKRIILSESLEEIKLSDENKADERNTPLDSTAKSDTFDIIANDIVLIADRYITTSAFLINGKKILFDNNVRSIYNDKILPNSNIISSAEDTHIYELPISTALKVGGDIAVTPAFRSI